VYARAIDIQVASIDGILRQLLTERNRAGEGFSAKEFSEMISEGSLRVMIDGLDEAGSSARQLASSILLIGGEGHWSFTHL
jgi:hypothetical protein